MTFRGEVSLNVNQSSVGGDWHREGPGQVAAAVSTLRDVSPFGPRRLQGPVLHRVNLHLGPAGPQRASAQPARPDSGRAALAGVKWGRQGVR